MGNDGLIGIRANFKTPEGSGSGSHGRGGFEGYVRAAGFNT